ncbi:MAG: 3-deoxy-manno-octulosonate cytidylyltransferase [Legionellaceae bacterium]|nr:3-deoxy-manno-octulosonate cytidylyltransferase [Legionellaceae bacterium]
MSVDFHVIIPARLDSSRLPGKLLLDINGQSVLERTYRQALLANPQTVTIATDSDEIAKMARGFGATVVMTSKEHSTGTDRIAEACTKLDLLPENIIVNLQGDEPFISPVLIKQVANSLDLTDVSMATLCWPIEDLAMLTNPNVVKLVRDCKNNALYFSRAAIPATQGEEFNYENTFRHIGIYAYRVKFLLEVVKLPVCNLENKESLEQLRALWYGYKIKVDKASVRPQQEINTKQDLEAARCKSEAVVV